MSDQGSTETVPAQGRFSFLWAAALVLATVATGVLVLSNDARLLRLGLLAALWSALFGAFVVARLRHRVADSERAVADRQRVYELELEREITARHEFELEVEVEARRQARAEAEGELKALQDELHRLRTTLEQLMGGDVLFERVALQAESTRVRSLADSHSQQYQVIQHPARNRELAPAPPPAPPEPELMSYMTGELPVVPPTPRPKPQMAQAFPNRQARTGGRIRQDQPRPPARTEPPESVTPDPPADPAGAHSAGTSVSDLLAAYGGPTDTQRRRRRRA